MARRNDQKHRRLSGKLACCLLATTFLSVISFGGAQAVDSYTVAGGGGVANILEHSVCKKVTNNYGQSCMVPTKTSGEWSSFYSSPPASVSVTVTYSYTAWSPPVCGCGFVFVSRSCINNCGQTVGCAACGGNCSTLVDCGGCTCFPAGTRVRMADGTWKAIENVRIGDRVKGLFGYDNEVLALDRPKLGHRPLYLINGELFNTAEHMMWTDKGWGVISLAEYIRADYQKDMPVIVDEETGREEMRTYHGVNPEDVCQVGVGDRLGYGDGGYREIKTLEECWVSPETQLYALVLDGSHSMMLEGGYVVSGWARDDDFDYRTGRPRHTAAPDLVAASHLKNQPMGAPVSPARGS